MSRSATSVLVFGVYLALLGVVLLVVPNALLGAVWTGASLRRDRTHVGRHL